VREAHLNRRLLAEFLGSALLAAVVIGSGIAAQQLSPGETGLGLLENAVATGAGLYALILMFLPVSGAHFNPVVSAVDAALGGVSWRQALAYLPAQVVGCVSGAVLANLMFSGPAVSISTRTARTATVAGAVGAYIGAAYFFCSSTSFANPAITVGRMFSNTFAGIAPSSAPAFIGAQVLGGAVGLGLITLLYPRVTPVLGPSGDRP
jgi:glycerol uptake facilitator-like aquaporin